MKKLLKIIFSTILSVCTALPFFACSTSDNSSSTPPISEPKEEYYVTLNSNEVTIGVGETFSLEVKKFNESNEETEISSLTYVSDAPKIASVENGTITAKQTGETYIHVKADGLSTACFVTVKKETVVLDGFVIMFTTEQLFVGVPAQAYAGIYKDGELIAEPAVSWSVADEETLSITESGLVTPKKTAESTCIFAEYTYQGTTYSATKEIAVVEPLYYTFSNQAIELATPKTVSGSANTLCVSKTLNLLEVNAISGESRVLSADEYEINSMDETIATVAKQTDGTSIVTAKAAGKGKMRASITTKGETVGTVVNVSHAVASVADMDALSLAGRNQPQAMQEDYILVSDIDYQGDVVMPIVPFCESVGSRSLGVQWKYRLTKTDAGYGFVDRADFGKTGTGLMDEQFATFVSEGGWNPKNAVAFSGTFNGNGYSIKNAALFYGIWQKNASADEYYANNSHIFGLVSGTICNLSVENLTLQNPKDIPLLDQAVTSTGTIVNGGLTKNTTGGYYYRSASLVGKLAGGTVKNVYLDLDTSALSEADDGWYSGALVSGGAGGLKIENCVVKMNVTRETNSYRITGVNGNEDLDGYYANNFVLGTESFRRGVLEAEFKGVNGNYWCKTDDPQWKDLLALQAGATGPNVKTVQQAVETYDTGVWDMSNFQTETNGRPTLKKGCSTNS